MKKYWRYLISVRTELIVLFIVALLTIILIEFWLIEIPEKFNGGAKFGVIVNRLCISYISAFIFYFLVVHLKTQKDKENLYSYISGKVRGILNCSEQLIDKMIDHSKTKIKGKYPTDSELKDICRSINPHSNAPLILGKASNYANWIQLMLYYKQRSNKATEKVFLKINFLDSDLVILLAKIDDCSHFQSIEFFSKNMPLGNTDFLAFQPDMLKYFELINELNIYYQRRLINYGNLS
nr:hypothetical protein [uncultured Allomuricauda sp.]